MSKQEIAELRALFIELEEAIETVEKNLEQFDIKIS